MRGRQCNRARNRCVMTAEGVQTVGVGSGDQRFTKFPGDAGGAPVWIERAFVKMAKLDRIEAIDLLQQSRPDGTAQNIEWMRCDRENRIVPAGPERADISECFQAADFFGGDIEQNN